MDDAPRETVKRANERLAIFLEGARRGLRGEGDFDVQDVRRLRKAIGEMALVVAQWAELRRLQPEIAGELDHYRRQLSELQIALVRIKVMLHARRASMEAGQVHNAAVSRWVSAFQQTR